MSNTQFSITTMTSVGYGDISPGNTLTATIVNAQMLINLLYTSLIFSIGLDHFCKCACDGLLGEGALDAVLQRRAAETKRSERADRCACSGDWSPGHEMVLCG